MTSSWPVADPSSNTTLAVDAEDAKALLSLADGGLDATAADPIGDASSASPTDANRRCSAELSLDNAQGSCGKSEDVTAGTANTAVDTESSEQLPALPALPTLTPLPPLPSVSSSDPAGMFDMLSAVASVGSDPPSVSTTLSAGEQNMTEAEVDAAIQAEMAELKAEIAALRSSIGDTEPEPAEESQATAGEDDVLRMAQFKLDYVEKNLRRL